MLITEVFFKKRKNKIICCYYIVLWQYCDNYRNYSDGYAASCTYFVDNMYCENFNKQ